jgi:ribosomal protein S18 acetylase RimI-like enzyme
MATQFRSRAWSSRADLLLVQALARARLDVDWPALRIHPGDLDWWVVGAFGAAQPLEERVRLWFDAGAGSEDAPGDLVAFAWFGHLGQIDFEIAADEPAKVDALVREIVAWAERLGPVKVWASLAEPAAASLAALGFERASDAAFVYLTGDMSIADRWQRAALPAGLRFAAMTGDLVEARVICSRAAFPTSTMTPERYRQTFKANLYRGELDLLIVDAEGRVVAFALGWLDPASGVVELEPVGVDPEFHRQGLGREICRATLRRARDLGATRAVIGAESDNPASVALYQSLGLSISIEIVGFARDVPAH